MTFTVVPTWIDPNLSNNADRVLIGAGASDAVPAAESVALGLIAANLTLLAAKMTRSRTRFASARAAREAPFLRGWAGDRCPRPGRDRPMAGSARPRTGAGDGLAARAASR